MSEPLRVPPSGGGVSPGRNGDSLADILERILDKGVVIAGDIRVDLLDIELLTIRIRLLISSADKAAELGMAWWRQDPFFTGQQLPGSQATDEGAAEQPSALQRLFDGTEDLRRRVAELEGDANEASPEPSPARSADDNDTG